MQISRRKLIEASLALAALGPAAASRAVDGMGASEDEATNLHEEGLRALEAYMGPAPETPEDIAILVYPGMTVQDFVGPQLFFSMMPGANVHLVSKDPMLSPIMGDTGFAIVPTISMANCPLDLDVLFMTGGSRGAIDAMADEDTIAFVQERAARAKWINAICTGTLILGQAGLLEGKRAATHWASMSLLPMFGAIPVHERVVIDGNLVTGGGISAGLDFGLFMVSQLRNLNTAKYAQLIAEYQPQPFIQSGRPDRADPELLAALEHTTRGYLNAVRNVVNR